MIVHSNYATPADFEWPSKLDRAITAGYDPHPDDMLPPAAWIEAEFQASGYDSALDWFAAGVEAAQERWGS